MLQRDIFVNISALGSLLSIKTDNYMYRSAVAHSQRKTNKSAIREI